MNAMSNNLYDNNISLRPGFSEYVSVKAPIRSAPMIVQSGRQSQKSLWAVVPLERNREGLDFGQYEEVSPSKLIALALSLLLLAGRPILAQAKAFLILNCVVNSDCGNRFSVIHASSITRRASTSTEKHTEHIVKEQI